MIDELKAQIEDLSTRVRQRNLNDEFESLDDLAPLLAQRLVLIKQLWQCSNGTKHEAEVADFLTMLMTLDEKSVSAMKIEQQRLKEIQQSFRKGHKAVNQYTNIKRFR
ncbi:hypothetical protein [Motilimonas eburnea]|uniref:hypothetical protein n=1 Tax=Motilimonas eburnea TaxID=1737488 RepID=UPI001E3AAB30|nr:hypothetical protein [Motilimonas eburnea]MCE2571547.1 hypothetical protein [Motilimonas eburnea]